MSDITPQFGPDGLPVLHQQQGVDQKTGLPIDSINMENDLTDEQIGQALKMALRGDEGSFTGAGGTPGPEGAGEGGGDGTWAEELGGQGAGDGAGSDGSTSASESGSGAAGEPFPGSTATPPSAGAPAAPGAPTEPSPPALPEGYILAPITSYNEFTGKEEIRYVPAPVQDIGNVLGWVNGISPQDRQEISDWLEAKRNGIPAALPNALSNPAASGSGPNAPGAPVPGATGYPSQPGYQGQVVQPQIDYSQLDPDLAAVLQTQAQALAQTQAQNQIIAQQLQAQQAQQQDFITRQANEDRNRLSAAMTQATTEFAATHNLTQEQLDSLTTAAANLNILPAMHAKHGNPKDAVTATLETAMWATPEFRQQAINSSMTDSLSANAQAEQRKRNAAALSAGGGNVPRVAPPSRPLTAQEREQAMVNEIAAAMNGSAN